MGESDWKYRGLGYVGIEDPDPAAWHTFLTEVCGASAVRAAAGDGHRFAVDERRWRIKVDSGETSQLGCLGFELADHASLDRLVAEIDEGGCEIRWGTAEEAAAREVSSLAVIRDPAGHRLELFAGPLTTDDFVSPVGAEFLTGSLGLGHVVVYVPDIDKALRFYIGVLGFRRSDYLLFGAPDLGIHFLRCSPRHHSIALLHIGEMSGLQHLMFEYTTLDAVGGALDLAQSQGRRITSSLGRHRNDRTVSFYMESPGGFDVELGWDTMLIDDDTWTEHEFTGSGDLWGHHGLAARVTEEGDL